MYTIHHASRYLRIALLVAMGLLLVLLILAATGEASSPCAAVPLTENTDLARAEFLSRYGWQISTVPLEVCDVTIPHEFDKVYTRYNDLQIAQGFDLTEYKGKTVKRFTYRVLNYPQAVEQVRANLLVYDQAVVGGDICTAALDGFMHGLAMDDKGMPLTAWYEVSDA